MTIKVSLTVAASMLALTGLAACSPQTDDKPPTPVIEAAATPDAPTPTFDAPTGWAASEVDNAQLFTAPENNAVLALYSGLPGETAEAAAAAAWAQYDPDFDRAVKLATDAPAARGWDALRQIEYSTSPAEQRVVYAFAQKAGASWSIILLDADQSTIAKRGAAARSMIDSLTRAGFESEDMSGRAPNTLTSERVAQLVNFVETSAKALSIPGVGIGIIQNGEVVFSGGVGLRDVEAGLPVTGDTRFMIASNTKGMTTLLLAKLVELGRMNWDDRVIDHYPDFRLGDADTTKSVLIRHLVCACTGLPRKDFEWVFNNEPDTPPSNVFKELAATQPTSGFGELYQYNNQMAGAAGYVAAHVLYPDMEVGAGYDRAMQEFIFDPLGMDDTTFDMAKAMRGNAAASYTANYDRVVQPNVQTDTSGFNHTGTAYRPAGAAWSTPTDMLKYIQNELSAGMGPDGERLFAEAPLLQRRVPTVQTGSGSAYGMGLSTQQVAGIEVIEHGGSMAGYKSQMAILPDANVGAVILTNSDDGYALADAFTRRLVEVLYDGEDKAAAKLASSAESLRSWAEAERAKLTIPADTAVVEGLMGYYVSDLLGEVELRRDGEAVIMDAGLWFSPLGSRLNEDGSVSLVPVGGAAIGGVDLLVGEADGTPTLSLITPQHSYLFTKRE